jgi:UMF1 family MFS transporter
VAAPVSAGPGRKDIPVTRREIFGWAMFDFANSSYTTVVITVVYGTFFVGYIVPAGSSTRDSYWSLAIILGTLVALVLSPLAGAISDLSGRKKTYLVASSVVCSAATAALGLVGPGQLWPAIALVVVSNAGFLLSQAFCASFLPDIATPATMGKISGLGWGIGYFGGLASVIVASRLIIRTDPLVDAARHVTENQQAMVAIGLFFLVAALPTFLFVRNRSLPAKGYERAGPGRLLRAGLRELAQSARTARAHPVLFRFLFAFTVYMAGLEAIIKFVGIYAREEVRLSIADLGVLFLVLQLSAAAGALGFGVLEGRIGPKRTVLLTIGWWIAGVLGIYFLGPLSRVTGFSQKSIFFALGLFAGAGMGAIQASSRAVVGLLSPRERSAQMFGFWNMFGQVAAILGVTFGFAADWLDSRRTAVLLIVLFFVVGGLLLWRVDVERGVREAEVNSTPI